MKIDEDVIHETLTKIKDGNFSNLSEDNIGISLAYYAITECFEYGDYPICFLNDIFDVNLSTFDYVLQQFDIRRDFSHRNLVLTVNNRKIYFMWDSKQAIKHSMTILCSATEPKIYRNYRNAEPFYQPDDTFFTAMHSTDIIKVDPLLSYNTESINVPLTPITFV